ncbi:MAG: amidohydrolase family protein [Sphingomonadaceae bacterium]|nr:amidohydrolase family protein [Sphingomonadaceae bacterium]
MQRIWQAACLTLLACITAPAAADTLIDNVDGMTLDGNGRPIHFNGLVIDDAGRIARLLQRGDARPERPDFRQDGRGAVLIPGLIDAHGHVMELGFKLMLLDLAATRSLDEALAAIRQYAADNPETPWIMGSGWNQESWGLGRFPTAAELDSAVGDRPVWLMRVDGHAGWANSRAMQLAGVTAATRAPDGGRIERVGGGTSGAPSGVFVDNAVALIEAHKPQPLARDRDRALALAQNHLLSLGITATSDMGTTIEDWQTFRRAGDAGRLNVRIISYGAGIENMALIAGGEPTPWLYDDHLRLIGVKLYLDGALGSRGAWLLEPYSDAAGQRGLPLTTASQLRNRLVRASMDGFQVAIHAIGDAANAEALAAIEDVSASFTGDRRWRIEHAQIVRPEDLARFGRDHIIASMQPVHQTSDRLMAEARLGEARLSGAYAWRSIHEGGARLAFGSDYPVESPDPFAGIAAAISRTDAAGEPFGGWHSEQAVSREVAIDGFTRSAAYAGFAEDRIGTLMPGMRADFLLVDTDPLLASPGDIRKTRVSETWVGGRAVWSRAASARAAARPTAPTPPAGSER